jgi:hypothetical protein
MHLTIPVAGGRNLSDRPSGREGTGQREPAATGPPALFDQARYCFWNGSRNSFPVSTIFPFLIANMNTVGL